MFCSSIHFSPFYFHDTARLMWSPQIQSEWVTLYASVCLKYWVYGMIIKRCVRLYRNITDMFLFLNSSCRSPTYLISCLLLTWRQYNIQANMTTCSSFFHSLHTTWDISFFWGGWQVSHAANVLQSLPQQFVSSNAFTPTTKDYTYNILTIL